MKKKKDETLEEVKNPEMEKIKQVNAELTGLLKRAQADFVNFRNRVEAEKKDWVKYGEIQVLMDLIQVLDNFSQAAKHVPEDIKSNQWVLGVQNIEKQFEEALKNRGIEKIDAVGQLFDPSLHEALFMEESDKPEDTVLEVFADGYKLGDKIIRPARVKVSKGKG
ncbi:MAG: Protein GrpE [candidate division CPR2 bacterium GW2011_GWC1_41_48]|uniref:Protein GrpE n=1 Tax=candidate division CPR2 bacterium GW2011_GWC1_41_48 TaxID=1618344 RepID=A0A0G0W997_UNCC2|nr:MAG: Protein GrpE [candidate division CPR2 bacterium GW2011_GWC2_39_35]KKR27519.1 MAG: Protein GrpE [candidate division CPR2 bacterium GW2011_GWD2_39_7]KKS08612.1 MAG: Protein GrpE [candidate division CPR2 bacterium GW2011_GWC1_41_48]OGB71495.1 MAG: nucleotide exchange factor GrpE [candidate division CPR2 bacterium GWD2_39_7]